MATWRKCCNFITKQIIGQYPSGGGEQKPQCFWYGEYNSALDNTFNDSTLNGQPFNVEIYTLTGNASNSMNLMNNIFVYDTRCAWTLTDDPNTLPTLPIGYNSMNDPLIGTWWEGSCELKCYELVVPKTDLIFSQLYLGTPSLIMLNRDGFGVPFWDVSNASHISIIDTYYKSFFGNQASVTSTLDSNNDYVVQIRNTYENNTPYWDSLSIGTLIFYEITC